MPEKDSTHVQRVVRPLDSTLGDWVSADGLSEPIYFADKDTLFHWYGCGDAHHPGEENCGTAYCHGRQGDDRT